MVSPASMRPRLEAGECIDRPALNQGKGLASMRPRLEAGECPCRLRARISAAWLQ